jgi:5-(hydroxymethyl)furfural/furfural oxidase
VFTAVERAGWTNIRDQNAVFSDGFAPVAHSHTDDQRMGAAWRYLTAAVRRRPNLTVIGDTHVERVVFDGIRATGIAVRRGGERTTVQAREIVVSSGALQSPALLMRSGIGPGRELKALGIDVLVDRPGIGKHLMEHPGVNLGCWLRPQARLPRMLRRQMFAGLRWSSGHEGCPPGDMYLIPSNKAQWHAIGERLGLMMLWINRSYSTGEVTLKSADPAAPLDIDFNMCSDARDMDRMVTGVRLMCRLASDPAVQEQVEQVFPISYSDWARKLAVHSRLNAMQTYAGAMLMDSSQGLRRFMLDRLIADAPSLRDLEHDDEACREWIRGAVLGHWHASCTCRMGAPDDPGAVTDPSARVYGVEGLRVADNSIMPMVPCANTNIPAIMIGEKVAATIVAGR